ncbi:hypothetical protein DPMN_018719 [Dreissena polymorpha]|uniref:Uncharacterized protein n=1 Tax=Dreissena polymorpha TaxID=45954 RepID=A0A9D4NH25_DREPO|nr:hypothetical protein DPMN_018719 [Dreissena polymorpha]
MTLLIGLYYLYNKSPKQKKALKRAFVMMDFKASIMPTRMHRWDQMVATLGPFTVSLL